MADFKFRCPHCKLKLEASEEAFGTTFKCPRCGGEIALPKLELTGDIDSKICPFCAEDIRKAAVKCKHCGSDIGKKARTKTIILPRTKKS